MVLGRTSGMRVPRYWRSSPRSSSATPRVSFRSSSSSWVLCVSFIFRTLAFLPAVEGEFPAPSALFPRYPALVFRRLSGSGFPAPFRRHECTSSRPRRIPILVFFALPSGFGLALYSAELGLSSESTTGRRNRRGSSRLFPESRRCRRGKPGWQAQGRDRGGVVFLGRPPAGYFLSRRRRRRGKSGVFRFQLREEVRQGEPQGHGDVCRRQPHSQGH